VLSALCRYYRMQQTGYEWKESGLIDPTALAVLKEDSQRQVGDQAALDVLAVYCEGL
jgi:hypothetical protein